MNQWILIANASRARVFSLSESNGRKSQTPTWNLERELSHPASRAKGMDLVTDKPGRMQQSAGGGHRPAMEERHEPKENEAIHFARELADVLEDGHSHNRYASLVLVAPPHFLGLLRESISQQVEKRVQAALDKDYTHVPLHELPSYVSLNDQ